MAKEWSILVEYAWSLGHLKTQDEHEKLIQSYYQILCQRHGVKKTRQNIQYAVVELGLDLAKTLKILRYGGRKPSDQNPQRKEWLKQKLFSRCVL